MKNNKKLKITFLDFDDIKNPLLGAGQAKATLEVGKRLAEKGHILSIISSRFPGSQDRFENGLNYKHIGLGTKNIKINNFTYILTLPLNVLSIDADIIVECFSAPISTLFSPLFTRVPVVGLPTMFEAEEFSKKYHLPLYAIEKFGCRFYKYFLPYTKAFDQKMKKYNPQVISKIVPEGVGEEFFKIKRKSPKHILFLGRFDIEQKGIDLLLQSYSLIADKIKYPLVIAGHGPDEDKIKTMIKKLNLEKKVRIVGSAYGEKKAKLLAESVFVAFPSRHEGFPLFSLEALASGQPLVAFDIPGLSWSDHNVVLKAKKYDIKSYAGLMLKMGSEKQLYEKTGLMARQFASNYSWQSVADQFERFFYDIINLEKK